MTASTRCLLFTASKRTSPKYTLECMRIFLHYYDSAEYFTLVTTVADKKKHYSKQYIKTEERVA